MRIAILVASGAMLCSSCPCVSQIASMPRIGRSLPGLDSGTQIQVYDTLLRREAALRDRVDALQVEEIAIRAKVDTATNILGVAAAIMGLLLAVGTGASLFGFVRAEKRAVESFQLAITGERTSQSRAAEAFQLAFAGERGSQARATAVHEQFLSGSKETLDLVNATLNLAKEASERAARTVESRARQIIDELHQSAKALLSSVPEQDDRALIANPGIRARLRSLAQKISGFEINRFILPETLQLSEECIFIRGMDFHLNQQFDDAFRNWNIVALSDADPSLRSLAFYWIGYEQNNLNQFGEAEQSFENATRLAQQVGGARRFELQRILFETRFFNKAKHPAASLVASLEHLHESILAEPASEEREGRRAKILVTLANVIYQRGRDSLDAYHREEAHQSFRKAAELYESVSRHEKWASFGLAEMLTFYGDGDEKQKAIKIFQKVRQDAIEESVTREEPRTKVLARTTELICCLHVPEYRHEISAIQSLVLQELGRVDERLTVYSPMQRRNVTKAEFQRDLKTLIATVAAP
jgi:tetratricopeptide (TPR) repeat protein